MFSNKTRQDSIQKMQQEELDLLIIGGGITGAGVAVQSAASGIKTGLIEMQDFAEGTSSRSTKLVHGGIRYLLPHTSQNQIQCFCQSMREKEQQPSICSRSK